MASYRESRDLHPLRAVIAMAALAGIALFSAPAAATEEKIFTTPEQAVDALLAAARAGNTEALLKVLGPGSRKLVRSGDAVADAQSRGKFLTAYQEENRIESTGDDRVVLAVGKDDWPFPFPIVRRGDGWAFDASAGAQEILARRIGANELNAIEVCHAYVDAQREYAEKDRNHDDYVEYAQKIVSSPGKRDGLYWPAAADEEESPIGPLMAKARAEGYTAEKTGHQPYHGYYYRILKGQGAAAKGGAYDYVLNGHMIAGFALVAFPARYGVSGIMTFIVNHDDVVYQKDLGPNTAKLAREMSLFDPDSGWTAP